MDFIEGTDAILSVLLQRDGQPFIPDSGTVSYTVLDHNGNPVVGHQGVPVVTSSTQVSIQIVLPALINSIAIGKRFERRTVTIVGTTNGKPFRIVEAYRVIPYLNFSVTPNQVRSFIGLQKKELDDDDIDLVAAYLAVEDDIGSDELGTALASGTIAEISANECVKLMAVLKVLPSVKNRMSQSEQDGTISFSRPVIKDFKEIEAAARDMYFAAKLVVTGEVENSLPLILVTTDTDPITGS